MAPRKPPSRASSTRSSCSGRSASAARRGSTATQPTRASCASSGAGLVALHGQHEHHALLDSDTQTELLDGYAGANDLRAAVVAAHAAWTAAVAGASPTSNRLRSRGQREQEYLRWQLEELRTADPRPGEDEELSAERSAVRHAARLAELSSEARPRFERMAVARAAAAVSAAADLDPRLAEQASRLAALAERVGRRRR